MNSNSSCCPLCALTAHLKGNNMHHMQCRGNDRTLEQAKELADLPVRDDVLQQAGNLVQCFHCDINGTAQVRYTDRLFPNAESQYVSLFIHELWSLWSRLHFPEVM